MLEWFSVGLLAMISDWGDLGAKRSVVQLIFMTAPHR